MKVLFIILFLIIVAIIWVGIYSIFQIDSSRFKPRYKNRFWEDKEWVQKNLFDFNIISEEQYKFFKGKQGIYSIKINMNGLETIYVGQSKNLIMRLATHIDNANNKTGNKQYVTNCIKKYHTKEQPIKWNVLKYYDWPYPITEKQKKILDMDEINFIAEKRQFYGSSRMLNKDEGGIHYP